MGINIARFYKREKLQLECEIITPMFLGNANQDAELRSAPFKGMLRYWWRVANGSKYKDHKDLLNGENNVFGSPDDGGGKSQVTIEAAALNGISSKKDNFPNPGNIAHPECEKTARKTNPLNYLAGMGLIHYRNGILHSYFPAGDNFTLTITASHAVMDDINSTLNLLDIFGAIGSRCRNGWGSFQWHGFSYKEITSISDLSAAFDRDYPHCLGRDANGPLFWKTKNIRQNWRSCMKDLAEIYVSIRAGNNALNIPKLDVNDGNPPERHLLGYPITHHNNVWGGGARHGSALRLLVRREADGYRGYFLHLPHSFSKEMWKTGPDRQIKIWQKVHTSLDKLCQRAQFEEAQV